MAPLTLFNEGVPAHLFCLMEVPTMRLPNVNMLPFDPLECIFVALLKIAHFWSNLIGWGYKRTLPLYHAFVIDRVDANGNPGTERKPLFALANDELQARRGWEFGAPPQGRRPEDRGPQQMSESHCFL